MCYSKCSFNHENYRKKCFSDRNNISMDFIIKRHGVSGIPGSKGAGMKYSEKERGEGEGSTRERNVHEA